MNRNILASLVVTGLAVTACGEAGDSENNPVAYPSQIKNGVDFVINTYGCAVETIPVSIDDLSNLNTGHFRDPRAIYFGMTDARGVYIEESLSPKDQEDTTTHESLHFCSDAGTTAKYDEPYQVSEDQYVTGASGFRLLINNQTIDEGAFNYLEEGVVEWLAAEKPNYKISSEYQVLYDLTSLLMDSRRVDKKTVVQLQQQDKALELMAIIMNKQPQAMTAEDVRAVVLLYDDVYKAGYLPSQEELARYNITL